MNIITIDTGKRGCGMALFCDNRLKQCTYAAAAESQNAERIGWHENAIAATMRIWSGWTRALTDTVIEFPRIYRGREQQKDQNDLLDLAAVAGGIAHSIAYTQGSCGFARYVHVSDWKGQLTKAQAWHHIWKRLSPIEQLVYTLGVENLPKALHHNVQDAVGIGLWACGRFTSRG